MSANSMREIGYKQGAEFFGALERAGFTFSIIQEVINSPGNKLAEDMYAAVSSPEVYIQLISSGHSIIIDATDGSHTFAGAKDVFTGYLDLDFTNYGCDTAGKPTVATQVEVYEMIKDGTFGNIFNSVGCNLDSMCLTQDQIIGFVKKHREWLRTGGYGTFFLFKVGDKFFVAGVGLRDGGRLGADVSHFSDGHVWDAGRRPRFVLPQLTA